jgi:hypothetical protein
MAKIIFLFLMFLQVALADNAELINASMKLSSYGVLKKTEEGLVYLDIDDRFINDLFSFINEEGFEKPPYFDKEKGVGAHITVVYPTENANTQVLPIGKAFPFTIKECQIVRPATWAELEALFLVTVDASQLDALRATLNLPKKTYSFHITIGVKYKKNAQLLKPCPY